MAKKEKSLRRLGRRALLELMLKQSEENEALKAEVVRLNGLLSAQREKPRAFALSAEVPGTMAEAALKLSGVMEAADEAARIFLSGVEKSVQERQEQQFEMQRQAHAHAARVINEAHEEAQRIRKSADDYWYRMLRAAEGGEPPVAPTFAQPAESAFAQPAAPSAEAEGMPPFVFKQGLEDEK